MSFYVFCRDVTRFLIHVFLPDEVSNSCHQAADNIYFQLVPNEVLMNSMFTVLDTSNVVAEAGPMSSK